MSIPPDYVERVYAGVLGKIIGVYLGRPFEGWPHERILTELGEVWYYVHERLGVPLIVADDDISGTFTFIRALEDYGYPRDLTPAQIGQTWLNYLIENRTVLWWGGLGNSTEHTAYLRLKHGIAAPRSGSIALNGKVVAEQIGAQIFIDGWAMVAPGDPELASDLARRAASVSHDGEAIYGAQVIAALEAQAFVEPNLDRLLDTALTFIPRDSLIARLITDLRELRAVESDWRAAFRRLETTYGYDRYGGNCHIIPNHGLIILSLLYGDDDFQKTLMIVNTCGWDTDCNSGNVGCLMGIKNGLAGIEAGPDWRAPVADRLYIPTADGGRAVSDAVRETYALVNAGRALVGLPPIAPKGGARFHFALPGAVQGFRAEEGADSKSTLTIENVARPDGRRALALRYHRLAPGRAARAATATFIPPGAVKMAGYGLIASPTLYAGQTVRACLEADDANPAAVTACLYLRAYGAQDQPYRVYGPATLLAPGEAHEFTWHIPATGGDPICEIGCEITGAGNGVLYLDSVTWDGAPDVTWTRPAHDGTLWRQAWVNGVDDFLTWSEPFRLIQNEGRGLLIQGAREWRDYRLNADVTPHLVKAAGIAVRVQGMRRYYALLLCADGKVRLLKVMDGEQVLAETDFPWTFGETHELALETVGRRLHGWVDGRLVCDVNDAERPLNGGAVALVCEEGRTATWAAQVQPASG